MARQDSAPGLEAIQHTQQKKVLKITDFCFSILAEKYFTSLTR